MAFESRRLLRPSPSVPLKKLGNVSRDLDIVQDYVESATQKARQLPHAKGRQVTLTAPDDGGTYPRNIEVSHGLGRKVQGYSVDQRSAACDDFHVGSNSRHLTVNVSAPATLTLWVY